MLNMVTKIVTTDEGNVYIFKFTKREDTLHIEMFTVKDDYDMKNEVYQRKSRVKEHLELLGDVTSIETVKFILKYMIGQFEISGDGLFIQLEEWDGEL